MVQNYILFNKLPNFDGINQYFNIQMITKETLPSIILLAKLFYIIKIGSYS